MITTHRTTMYPTALYKSKRDPSTTEPDGSFAQDDWEDGKPQKIKNPC